MLANRNLFRVLWRLLFLPNQLAEQVGLQELGVEGELRNAEERRDMANSRRQTLPPEASCWSLSPCPLPLQMHREAGVLDGLLGQGLNGMVPRVPASASQCPGGWFADSLLTEEEMTGSWVKWKPLC